jgi:hypothetical protein
MTPEEYRDLKKSWQEVPAVSVDEIKGPDRTLLYGYMVNRQTFHVYFQNGAIHVLLTTYGRDEPADYYASAFPLVSTLVPSKRVYPESTDADFVRLLAQRGADVPLLPFDELRYGKVKDLTFHGETWENGRLVSPR